MKLLWSSRSPFVRKVMVAAHETGLAGRIRTERVVVAANKTNADGVSQTFKNVEHESQKRASERASSGTH